MKNLKDIIESQNFLVNKKLKNRQKEYEYFPETTVELKNIIINLLEQGITDLNCIDVSKITNMSWLFSVVDTYITVENIDISEWNVSNVTDMSSMFYKCENFNSDLSKWNVSNVKTTCVMFTDCKKFNSDLSKWDVSNVTNMGSMFMRCHNFNSDLSNWNVTNVRNMYSMFYKCKKFNYDLSKWDVSNVNNMHNMFKNCDTLEKNNKIPAWYK